jgi:hypothetical protein
MLSSPNPQISSPIHPTARSLTSSISFTSFASFTPLFCFTQTLPTFSTPSKHRTHSNARNPFTFMGLLRTSRHTGGGVCLLAPMTSIHSRSSSRFNSRPALPNSAPSLSSLFAAKCTKLTPLFSCPSALFKKECLPKPFAINLFRTLSQNTRGGGLLFLPPSTLTCQLFHKLSDVRNERNNAALHKAEIAVPSHKAVEIE